MIMIEGAERFGLSQLHQLRGRVVRSNHQAYCFVCPESRGESTASRLKALVTAKSGFELFHGADNMLAEERQKGFYGELQSSHNVRILHNKSTWAAF